jgi:predicted DNA-binding transcriptional regulator YafY
MTPKIQRWFDLLAALLRRHYPASFEDLTWDVPAYQVSTQSVEARRRMFERDKDELRAFGVPITTCDIGDNEQGYRLDRAEFYLPYLAVLRDGRVEHAPRRVEGHGYRTLPTLAFEPDELRALEDVGPRLRTLGIPSLVDDARSALRKLGADLPLRPPEAAPASEVADTFELLNEALLRRKRVTFLYRSLNSHTDEPRTVEPYGLFFLGHHWYLAAVEQGEAAVKNFRLSRMREASVNPKRPGTRDYEIPVEFDLRSHARSRKAWELGTADVVEAVVRMGRPGGAARAVARLGEAVEGHDDRRLFRVRRPDTFVRWLLGLAGAVEPVSPPELVEQYRALARATLAIYAGDAA